MGPRMSICILRSSNEFKEALFLGKWSVFLKKLLKFFGTPQKEVLIKLIKQMLSTVESTVYFKLGLGGSKRVKWFCLFGCLEFHLGEITKGLQNTEQSSKVHGMNHLIHLLSRQELCSRQLQHVYQITHQRIL